VICVLDRRATSEEVLQMLAALESYIKLAVDVERHVIAGGGTLHADCEAALLETGSNQSDIWGADWLPYSREVTFESLINIRPRVNNFSLEVEDERLRSRIRDIVVEIFARD
jgi:hypothetical protein